MKIKGLSIILTLVFVASGSAKLFGLQFEVEAFMRWGYSIGFMYATGFLEVVGASLLWVQLTRSLAAPFLSCLMIGAAMTHLRFQEWPMLVIATVILSLCLWLSFILKQELYSKIKWALGKV